LENILAAFRRLLGRPWVPATVVFVAIAFASPQWIAALTTKHYTGNEGARMHVAVRSGDRGFYLYPTGVPSTLEQEPFLADGYKPDSPDNPDVPARARLLGRTANGVLMETVRMLDYVTVTSRYLVRGRQLVPVSQMSFGIVDKFLGTFAAAIVALACGALLARRRLARPVLAS
jgi:hypothetical protein